MQVRGSLALSPGGKQRRERDEGDRYHGDGQQAAHVRNSVNVRHRWDN
jgi:hypothetical protein